MRAVMLTALKQMKMVEAPEPRIERDTDVLLAVRSIGVCGSDVHYYRTGRIGSQVVQYPFRVGHEFSATVLKTGAKVRRVKPGDLVAVDPAMWCGQCDQCRAGRFHTCRHLKFLGCPGQAEGCLCERMAMPETSCFPVPAGVGAEQAAVAEPLSIGVYAVRQSVPMPGARIGILGCGPIGLSVLLAARAEGVARVYATDRIEARLAVARRLGVEWAGNPGHEDVAQAVAAREPLLLDAVFECCGEQEALDEAVQMLRPGGKLMLIGIPTVDRVSFGIDLLRRRELCIQNVRRQNECTEAALSMIQAGRTPVDFMITHRFALEQTREAFDLVAEYRDGVVKAVINIAT